jgi:hypothetical protein
MVSTAVLVASGEIGSNAVFYVLIILAQFLGGLLGIFWAWLVLMPSYIEGDEH